MAATESNENFFKRHARGLTISLSVLLLIISILSFWVTNNIYNSDRFANQVTSALLTEESRDVLATQIVDKTLEEYPIVRQAIGDRAIELTDSLLGTQALREAVYRFSYSANKLITANSNQPILINISGVVDPLEVVVQALDVETDIDFSEIPNEIIILDRSDVPNYKALGQVLVLLGPLTLFSLIAILVFSWKRTSQDGYTYLSDVGTVLVVASSAVFLLTYTSSALITINLIDPGSSQLMQAIYNTLAYNLRIYLVIIFIAGVLLKVYAAYRTNWWKQFTARFAKHR